MADEITTELYHSFSGPKVIHEEIWYELEYTRPGADDWYASSSRRDDEKAILGKLNERRYQSPKLEWRVVRKRLVTETL